MLVADLYWPCALSQYGSIQSQSPPRAAIDKIKFSIFVWGQRDCYFEHLSHTLFNLLTEWNKINWKLFFLCHTWLTNPCGKLLKLCENRILNYSLIILEDLMLSDCFCFISLLALWSLLKLSSFVAEPGAQVETAQFTSMQEYISSSVSCLHIYLSNWPASKKSTIHVLT